MEILLLLAKDTERGWSMEQVYDVILSSPHSVQRWLEALCASNLVERVTTPAGGYRCSADAEVLSQIKELGKFYQTSPVRVIEEIYKPADSAAQSFADAFRIKRSDTNR
jgi:hypothetical protein